MPPDERGRTSRPDLSRIAAADHTTLGGLVDWTADAIEALQVGDIERAQRDLNAIHYKLTALLPDREAA